MASRGNNNNNRGRGRGLPYRGRPWGSPGGQGSPRGRGSATPRGGSGRGKPPYHNLSLIDIDIQRYADENSGSSGYNTPSQGWRGGRGGWRARGRGRGAALGPESLRVYAPNARHGVLPPRREDRVDTPSGGRKRIPSRGLGASKYVGSADVPLSQLLTIDRPYLRPIKFVPAQLTPVLFEREEEIIEVPQIIEPEDFVPTADRIARVFSHTKPPEPSFFYSPEDDVFGGADSEPLVTVDFGSLGKFVDAVSEQEVGQHGQPVKPKVPQDRPEEQVGTSIFDAIKNALAVNGSSNTGLDTQHSVENVTGSNTIEICSTERTQIEATRTSTTEVIESSTSTHNMQPSPSPPPFVVDPNPSTTETAEDITFIVPPEGVEPLGIEVPQSPGDEEIIVYEAPKPRSGRATPSVPPVSGETETSKISNTLYAVQPIATTSRSAFPAQATPSFNEISFSFNAFSKATATDTRQINTPSPRSKRLTKKERLRSRKTAARRKGGFGAYGAMLEELHLHEEEEDKIGQRRQGSDIDWGDGDSEVEKISSSLGAMSVDSDVDQMAYNAFVKGMSRDGMAHTGIEDLEDVEKMRLEDEEEAESSDDDSELDQVVDAEERMLVAEDESEDSDGDGGDDVSSDEEETPQRNFQARLAKVRSHGAKGKAKVAAQEAVGGDLLAIGLQNRLKNLRTTDSDEDDDEDDEEAVEEEDDYEAYGKDLTWADRDEDFIAGVRKILDENQEILSGRDRKQKKAIFKAIHDGDFITTQAIKKRNYGAHLPPELRVQWEQDRARKAENKRQRALDRLATAADPFASHKGGKKGQKDMLRAAKLARAASSSNSDLPTPNAIVDADSLIKQIRAFVTNLGGPAMMSLPPMEKTARAKVHQIAQAFKLKSVSKGKGEARYTTLHKTTRTLAVGGVDERKVSRALRGLGGGGGGGGPRHKDGDEVGKEAPKIGEGNIGFKILSTMGWAEGDQIGVSGGLEAPVTAIIKTSKLGLGATPEHRKGRY